MTKSTPSDRNRFETALAYAAAGVIGISVITMVGTLLWLATGATDMPAILGMIPMVGLPFGFLLVIALLVTTMIRRSKEQN